MPKKVLIFGSSGWLGRITLNYFKKNNLQFDTTLVSSKRRLIKSGQKSFNFISPIDLNDIQNQSFVADANRNTPPAQNESDEIKNSRVLL